MKYQFITLYQENKYYTRKLQRHVAHPEQQRGQRGGKEGARSSDSNSWAATARASDDDGTQATAGTVLLLLPLFCPLDNAKDGQCSPSSLALTVLLLTSLISPPLFGLGPRKALQGRW